MFFSFIVPVYNTSKYLDNCMESLLCQKGADFEVVLLDDGSTDNSGEMCDSYAEKYPDIVRVIHKDNEGLLMTRRRGFKEAKGDWFICVDSDDCISSELLLSVAKSIDDYNPDLVLYNFEYFSDDSKRTSSRLHIEDKSVYIGEKKVDIYRQRLLSDDVNSMCMKAIRRDILDIENDYSQCGIRNMSEDALQSLPVFTNAQKIVYLAKPLYYYRKGQESITAVTTYANWMAIKICFFETEKYVLTWNIPDELQREFYTHNVESLSNFLRWAFSQDSEKLEKSIEEIIHTINIHPSFEKCMKMYDKKYAKTSYLKLSVPIIMRFVKKDNAKALKYFFAIERKILKRK